MKVTVCFGDVRVVVPCSSGRCSVKELIHDAVTRYQKAVAKSSEDIWLINVHSLRLMVSDGGFLDPDDCIADVVDDREQLTAVVDEPVIGRRHHHNNGDGMSVSSRGATSSAGSIHDGVANGSMERNANELDADQYAINGMHSNVTDESNRYNGNSKPSILQYQLKLELEDGEGENDDEWNNRSVESHQPLDDGIDHTVVSGLQQQQVKLSLTPTVGGGGASDNGSNINGRRPEPSQVTATKVAEGHTVHEMAVDAPNVEADKDDVISTRSDDETLILEFPKSSQPLGIHVIPVFDKFGKHRGIMIQSLEKEGRAERDGRLNSGDIFTEINGANLHDVEFLSAQEIFRQALKDHRLQLTVIRRANVPNVDQAVAVAAQQPVYASVIKKQKNPPQSSAITVTSPLSPDNVSVDDNTSDKVSLQKAAPFVAVRGRSQSNHDENGPRISTQKISIDLKKGPEGLGFTVTTRATPDPSQCYVYIKKIFQRGAAITDGRLKPGDMLFEINGQSMTDKTQDDAVALLRNTPTGGTVRLVVCRQSVSAIVPRRDGERPISTLGALEPLTVMAVEQLTKAQSPEVLTEYDGAYETVDLQAGLTERPNSTPPSETGERPSQSTIDRNSVRSAASSATDNSVVSSGRSINGTRPLSVEMSVVEPAASNKYKSDSDGVDSTTSSERRARFMRAAVQGTSDLRLDVSSLNAADETQAMRRQDEMLMSEGVQPTTAVGTMRSSRKSMSMDNLHTAFPNASADAIADHELFERSRLNFTRKVNQSFRAAVDKSFDVPTAADSKLNEPRDGKKKKNKKDEGKSGFKWFFRFPRHRSKSTSKEVSSEAKSPDLTHTSQRGVSVSDSPRPDLYTIINSQAVTESPTKVNDETVAISPGLQQSRSPTWSQSALNPSSPIKIGSQAGADDEDAVIIPGQLGPSSPNPSISNSSNERSNTAALGVIGQPSTVSLKLSPTPRVNTTPPSATVPELNDVSSAQPRGPDVERRRFSPRAVGSEQNVTLMEDIRQPSFSIPDVQQTNMRSVDVLSPRDYGPKAVSASTGPMLNETSPSFRQLSPPAAGVSSQRPLVPGVQNQLQYGSSSSGVPPPNGPQSTTRHWSDTTAADASYRQHQNLRTAVSLDSDAYVSPASRQMPPVVVPDRQLQSARQPPFVEPRTAVNQLPARLQRPAFQLQTAPFNDGYPTAVDMYPNVNDKLRPPQWKEPVENYQSQRQRPPPAAADDMNERLRRQQLQMLQLQQQQQQRYQTDLSAGYQIQRREPAMYQDQLPARREPGSAVNVPGTTRTPSYGQPYQGSAGYDRQRYPVAKDSYWPQSGRPVQPAVSVEYDGTRPWPASASHNGHLQNSGQQYDGPYRRDEPVPSRGRALPAADGRSPSFDLNQIPGYGLARPSAVLDSYGPPRLAQSSNQMLSPREAARMRNWQRGLNYAM